jgi:hypothetical protein
VEIRHLFSGTTRQAVPLLDSSFIISTALIVELLFTVYLYCLLLLSVQCLLPLCVWGYSISLRQGSMTGIVSLCIRSTSHHMAEHPLGVPFWDS